MMLRLSFYIDERSQIKYFVLVKKGGKVETNKKGAVVTVRLAHECDWIIWNDPHNENSLTMSHSTKMHWKRERKRKDRSN